MTYVHHSAYLKHLKANNIDTGLLMQQIEDVIIKVINIIVADPKFTFSVRYSSISVWSNEVQM
jgi:hypothetical protein